MADIGKADKPGDLMNRGSTRRRDIGRKRARHLPGQLISLLWQVGRWKFMLSKQKTIKKNMLSIINKKLYKKDLLEAVIKEIKY